MAQVNLPRVRVFCTAPGTGTFGSLTRAFGSYGIAELKAAGLIATSDVIDYVASQGDSFEEATGTIDAGGNIVRPATTTHSRHAAGTINTSNVNFSSGVVTIIGTFKSSRVGDLVTLASKAIRADQVQALSTAEKRQAQDNAGFFETGTLLPFPQASAPISWTKQTTHDDKAMRVVSGAGGGSGGSLGFSTVFGKTSTDNYTLALADIPAHFHTSNFNSGDRSSDPTAPFGSVLINPPTGGGPGAQNYAIAGGSTGFAYPHTHVVFGNTDSKGGSGPHAHPMDIRTTYLDFIICRKD